MRANDFNRTKLYVRGLMNDIREKRKDELGMALIEPISDEFPWASNGIYLFFGRAGQGKSNDIWEHIYMSESLFEKPYYSLIIFCSTSGKLDKTTKFMAEKLHTQMIVVEDDELLEVLNKHLRRKTKYYSICQHILSKLKDIDDEMSRIIDKHELDDIEDRIEYMANKLAQYQTNDYPFRTLLVLDDFYGHPLISSSKSELVRILTKERHYNFTCIICAQNWRGIELHVKRQATDVVLYSGFSEEDFYKTMKQIPNSLDPRKYYQIYKTLTNKHDKFILHNVANKCTIIKNGEELLL